MLGFVREERLIVFGGGLCVVELAASQTAWLLGIGSVSSGLSQPLSAWLSDRTDSRVYGPVGLVVADMTATRAFYELLGMTFADPSGSGDHLEATGTGGFRLMLDTKDLVESFDPEWAAGGEGGRARLAVDCGDAAGVDDTYAAVTASGHRSHRAPFDAFWGQRYASVLDPDGTIVDLFADVAGGA